VKQRILILSMTLILSLIPLAAYAGLGSIPYTYGFGARGIAMGSAYTALGGDASCAFYNPAAMASLEHSEFLMGYLYAAPQFEGGPKNGDTSTFDTANSALQVNMLVKLNEMFKSRIPFAFGFNLALDDNGAAFIRFFDIKDEQGYFYRYGESSFLLNGTLGVGITDWLFIGGGVMTTLHSDSNFYVETDLAGNTENEGIILDADVVIAPIGSLFLHFKPVDVGLTYHGQTHGEFVPITVTATAYVGPSPLADLPMKLLFKDSYFPHRVGLGALWRVTDTFKVSGDVVWYNWDRFDEEMGNDDLPRDEIDINFVDIYVPHLGLEWEATESLFLRAGYGFEDTPVDVPGSNGNVILDSPKHIASAGLGYTWVDPPVFAKPLSFDGAYFMHYLLDNELTTGDDVEYESSGIINGGVFSITLRY